MREAVREVCGRRCGKCVGSVREAVREVCRKRAGGRLAPACIEVLVCVWPDLADPETVAVLWGSSGSCCSARWQLGPYAEAPSLAACRRRPSLCPRTALPASPPPFSLLRPGPPQTGARSAGRWWSPRRGQCECSQMRQLLPRPTASRGCAERPAPEGRHTAPARPRPLPEGFAPRDGAAVRCPGVWLRWTLPNTPA